MRFLLVSQARSGTHMLRAVFRQCSSVVAFHDYMGHSVVNPGEYPRKLRTLYQQTTKEQIVGAMTHFGEGNAFYRTDWQQLRNMHDKIVVLTRSNHLMRYLSRMIMKRTGDSVWKSDTPRKVQPKPLEVSLAHYFAFKDRGQQVLNQVLPILGSYLAITYEELCSDWDSTTRRIYEYLNLAWDDPTLLTVRQETRQPTQIISNYAELMQEITELRQQLTGESP